MPFGVLTLLLAGEKLPLLSPSSFSTLQLLHRERMSREKMTGLLGHFLCGKGSGEMKSPRSPFCKRRVSLLLGWRTERAPLQHRAGRGPAPLCFGAVFSPVPGLCCEPAASREQLAELPQTVNFFCRFSTAIRRMNTPSLPSCLCLPCIPRRLVCLPGRAGLDQ